MNQENLRIILKEYSKGEFSEDEAVQLIENLYRSKNPIKDNRIVNDKTFAIRLRDFIKRTDVYDAASDEEKCYLLNVAQSLLDYQIETVTDESELRYLDNIKDLI